MPEQVDAEGDELLVFNGISGLTGEYLTPPISLQMLADVVIGHREDKNTLGELKWRCRRDQQATYALKSGLDDENLAEAGWGVVFPAGADPRVIALIRESLGELLDLRKAQAGQLYKEYIGGDGYRPQETKVAWLGRHGAGPGAVDPAFVPYYLLIVGDPQSISYRFQHELDVAYAVGRIHFQSTDEYAQYARSVVTAETEGMVALPRRAVFWGVRNSGDRATALSSEFLVRPLVERLAQDETLQWQIDGVFGEDTQKEHLMSLLGGGQAPTLLFTASHGVGYPSGHSNQMAYQGAIVCQDWPGPESGGLLRSQYFAAEDVADETQLLGMIVFHFACFSAGTPYWDNYAQLPSRVRTAIAPYAFIAALPQRLLSHPRGGALAVIGHVDRAWTCSFNWENATKQTATFESVLRDLMHGKRVGSALDYLNLRYAEIATILSGEIEEAEYREADPYVLVDLWTANNDARGYALIGDPAVRLPLAEVGVTGIRRPASSTVIQGSHHRSVSIPPVLDPNALL